MKRLGRASVYALVGAGLIAVIMCIPLSLGASPPYSSGFGGNNGWPPCSGANTYSNNVLNANTGAITMYDKSQSTSSLLCGSNTANKNIWAGFKTNAFTPTKSSYKFSFSVKVVDHLEAYCGPPVTYSGGDWTRTFFFWAIYDQTTGQTPYGNLYWEPSQLQVNDNGSTCDTGGTGISTYDACGTYTLPSYSVSLSTSDTYVPRVGIQMTTFSAGAAGNLDNSINDATNYDSGCAANGGFTVNSITLT